MHSKTPRTLKEIEEGLKNYKKKHLRKIKGVLGLYINMLLVLSRDADHLNKFLLKNENNLNRATLLKKNKFLHSLFMELYFYKYLHPRNEMLIALLAFCGVDKQSFFDEHIGSIQHLNINGYINVYANELKIPKKMVQNDLFFSIYYKGQMSLF